MKNIGYIFLALMLCLCCVGGVSAFQISEEAVINPDGVLGTGETVTAEMEIKFPAGAMEMGNELTLTTELVSPVWTTKVFTGGHEVTTRTDTNRVNSINGYLLGYQQEVILTIELTGTVSSASAGTSIYVLGIDQDEYGINELGTYSTPEQYVYNTADLSSDIAEENSKISALEARITKYNSYSADFTSAKNLIASAKTTLSNAKSYGTNDFRNAITSLNLATGYISQAEDSITKEILALINRNTNTVESTVSSLKSKGLTAEANLLSAANQGVKTSYTAALALFSNGSKPSVDDLFLESLNVLNIASNYASSTPSPTKTATPAKTATAAVTPTLTVGQTAAATVIPTPTNSQSIVITLPSVFENSDQIIFIESIIIIILCVVILINVLIIKHLLKKIRGGRRGRDSGEL